MTLTIPAWAFTVTFWLLPLLLFLPWPWFRRRGDYDFGPAMFGLASATAAVAWWMALIVSSVRQLLSS